MFCQFKKTLYFCIRNRETKYRKQSRNAQKQDGPFVYRLGRKIFILERGVRLPHGLQIKNKRIK